MFFLLCFFLQIFQRQEERTMKTTIMAVMAAVCLMMAGIAHAELKDNGDGTITDTVRGLVWLKDANCFDKKTWINAMASATGLHSGQCGLKDGSKAGQWRLPYITE